MAETDKIFSTGFASGFYIGQEWSNTVPNILLYKNKQNIVLLFKWKRLILPRNVWSMGE